MRQLIFGENVAAMKERADMTLPTMVTLRQPYLFAKALTTGPVIGNRATYIRIDH